MSCYFHRLGSDLFASTDYTRSNWNSEIQHGSPPLALLTKAIEEIMAPHMRVGRLTLDILGAIPIAEMRVQARVERPGSRIALLSAEMSAERPDGPPRAVARVTAWALATSDTADAATDRYPPLIEGPTAPLELHWKDAVGYIESVQWRPQHDLSNGGRSIGCRRSRIWSTMSRRLRWNGWRWWSIRPMALAQRLIPSVSCS